MKFDLKIEYLGKKEKKGDTEKDIYHLSFKTYNAEISGKFERSEIRHLIQQLDNAII
jgi:Ca2+-binding EF-hand superfamily protein